MKPYSYLASTGLFLLIAATADRTIAQPITADPSNSDASALTGSAADLRISPRIGVGYTTSGAGFEGVTRFEGFIPLRQHPGHNITFFEPRFLLDNDGNVGGNLLVGHRAYHQASDRIWGGYLSLDNRNTDNSEFYQLGLGLESLGEVWDVRVNGYIPLGDSSQVTDERTFDTGFDVAAGFEGNQLVLSSRRERQTIRRQDMALGGFDVEVGTRLAQWNDGNGDLRSYAGLYFLDGREVDSTLGWRLGLEVRPTQNLTLGVTVQNDELFGTNVIGSVTLTFPRVRPRGPIPEGQELVARLGEPIRRTPSIAVDVQEERDITVEEAEMPLMNPEEEEAYRFIHVTLGQRQSGDGTFERPFGTVEEAIDDAISDGNTIIYVDGGRNPDIPSFTIPDRVSVLSQGPEQFLAGMPFPGFPDLPSRLPFSPVVNFDDGILVRLPLSGDGNFPTIRDASATNLVTMGDRTVLSGFQLVNAAENAIVASSVENVEIRDTIITNPGERGIFLNDVTGSAILFDNAIANAQGTANSGQGILIQNLTSGSLETAIQRTQIENSRVGLEVTAAGTIATLADPLQIVDIQDTTLLNNEEQGLLATAASLGNQEISFINGTIAGNGAEGVLVQATNVGSQELTVEDSSISQNASHGIRAVAGVANGSTTAAQEIFIRRNTIANNDGDGISIEANEVTAQEFGITDNVIQNNAGAGIRAIANNVSFQEYVTDADNNSAGINGNNISNNGDVGIELEANDSATLVADIQDNTLSGNETGGNPDLTVNSTANTVDVCVVLNNNISTTGIRLDNNSLGSVSGLFEIGNLNTVSARNTGRVTLLPSVSTFTDRSGISSCFDS